MSQDPIVPDAKDWTWSVRERCPECGFDASLVPATQVVEGVHQATAPWPDVLGRDAVDQRPAPTTWSPLEYAGHVREVLEVFAGRFALVLEQDDPMLPNWDQDVAAISGEYAAQEPVEVARQIPRGAEELTRVLGRYDGADWDRPTQRSDGAPFTALTLARYLLHDLEHHLHDVGATRG